MRKRTIVQSLVKPSGLCTKHVVQTGASHPGRVLWSELRFSCGITLRFPTMNPPQNTKRTCEERKASKEKLNPSLFK